MTDFEKLVQDMRKAQKLYFAKRDKKILEQSKALERKVDEHLQNLKTPKLF